MCCSQCGGKVKEVFWVYSVYIRPKREIVATLIFVLEMFSMKEKLSLKNNNIAIFAAKVTLKGRDSPMEETIGGNHPTAVMEVTASTMHVCVCFF